VDQPFFHHRRARGFTLLEVGLIVAIIGMMMLIIVGYLMAPKQKKGAHPKPGTPKTLQDAATPAPATTPATGAGATPPAAPAFR
jgi:competence protein ComGC